MSSATQARVLAPLGTRALPIVERREHGAYVVLTATDPTGPHPQAGQFYMLRSTRRWGGGGSERPFLPRAFSVLRARSQDDGLELQFLLEAVGPGTERLAELVPGEELTLLGPLGRGFTAPGQGRRPVLVGGGVGIAPLAIWQDQLAEATVLLGFRDAAHAVGAELLPGARLATDDGSVGHHGLVISLLQAELEADADAEVYACGPPPMLDAIRRLLDERGVPGQLALESGMACGFGACFGCVVPTRHGYIRLCLEGPVLGNDELTDETFAVPGMGHGG